MHATRTLTKKEKNMILLLSASTCLLVYLWQTISSMPISMDSDLVSFFVTQVFISAIVGIFVGIVAYILVKYR